MRRLYLLLIIILAGCSSGGSSEKQKDPDKPTPVKEDIYIVDHDTNFHTESEYDVSLVVENTTTSEIFTRVWWQQADHPERYDSMRFPANQQLLFLLDEGRRFNTAGGDLRIWIGSLDDSDTAITVYESAIPEVVN